MIFCRKFEKLTGVAAPLDISNIDTDMIIPKQFLKQLSDLALVKTCLTRCVSIWMEARLTVLF